MKIQKIKYDDIVIEKPNADERTFSKDACQALAMSIENEGLLHEPILRPIADKPGKYRPVTGRNRLYACFKILKWDTVLCKIAPAAITDEEAKAMEYAENLFRVSLDDAQTTKALIHWRKIYDAKHPNASGKGAAQKQASMIQERVAEASAQAEAKGEEISEAKVEEIREQVAAETKPFSKIIQETLKVSATTAGRLARVAKNLEPEQVDVLAKHKVTDIMTDKLAALGDRELIVKAINLIASGMDHAEAIRQAGKAKKDREKPTKEQAELARGTARAAKKDAARAEAKPKTAKDSDLTDDEWLARHCEGILKLLKRKAPFKRDAILYRRAFEAIVRFRTSVKKPLAEAKGPAGENGGFFGVVARLVKAAHPRDWMVCGGCNGQGHILGPDKDGKESRQTCTQCHGGAYRVKLED